MLKLISALLTLPALAMPALAGVTIDYTVEETMSINGHSVPVHHRHFYTRKAMRADLILDFTAMVVGNAYIDAKDPTLFIKLPGAKTKAPGIREYEYSVLPDATITPLHKTKNILQCKTKGYKFKAANMHGTFWLCSDPQWAEANAFTSALLKTLAADTADFHLYKRLRAVVGKGVAFEAEARNNKNKRLFFAQATAIKKDSYANGFLTEPTFPRFPENPN